MNGCVAFQCITKDRKLGTIQRERKTMLHYKTVNLCFHCNLAIR